MVLFLFQVLWWKQKKKNRKDWGVWGVHCKERGSQKVLDNVYKTTQNKIMTTKQIGKRHLPSLDSPRIQHLTGPRENFGTFKSFPIPRSPPALTPTGRLNPSDETRDRTPQPSPLLTFPLGFQPSRTSQSPSLQLLQGQPTVLLGWQAWHSAEPRP